MIKVNILTLGPDSYNARAFLHPITFNLDLISGRKIDLGFHYEVSKSTAECDLLIIDSKFFKTWYLNRSGEMYNLLESFSKSTKVFYFFKSTQWSLLIRFFIISVKSNFL